MVAVARGRRVLNYNEPEAAVLQLTDRVIVIKSTVWGGVWRPDRRAAQ